MSAFVVMGVGEILIWGWNWNDGWLAAAETLSSSISAYGPTTGGGLTLASDSNNTTESQVKVTANARGHYVVANTVTTSAGQTGKRSLEIRVTDSP